jgi:DNA-binding transcriptional regulator LsrR (DeoR family)
MGTSAAARPAATLELHDRTEGPIMSVTQETLSQLLGVRRTTVTLMVAKLRAVGAIRTDRRGLIEIDRARLEEATCECYRIMRRAVTPRLHFPSAADLTVDDRFE